MKINSITSNYLYSNTRQNFVQNNAPLKQTQPDFKGRCNSCFTDKFYKIFAGIDFPRDYIIKTKQLVPATSQRATKSGRIIPAIPLHTEDIQILKPHYHINFLWADGNREGTNFVQDVVIKSLKDPRTQGRVILNAEMIDAETSPAGFYYKLGFRFANQKFNKILKDWKDNNGTKLNAPSITGMMYLPKENIEQCLRY